MATNHHYIGLTDAEVLESRKKYGVNILTPPEKETLWDTLKEACTHWIAIAMGVLLIASIVAAAMLSASMGNVIWVMPGIVFVSTLLIITVGFFGGFGDPLFKILITAFVLSMGISIYEFEWAGAGFSTFFEPIGIIVALLLATGVAFFLERSNEKTFQSLNEVNDDTLVKVIRNSNVCQIPRKDVVVGDIVILETGEEIPADCELLESLNLIVNESSLTGEPQANKTTDESQFDKDATYPSNRIMKGTTVIEGYCTARVLSVGDTTECGKLMSSLTNGDSDKKPFRLVNMTTKEIVNEFSDEDEANEELEKIREEKPDEEFEIDSILNKMRVNKKRETPLNKKLDSLADLITKTSYVFAALILVGRIVAYFFIGNHTFEWLDFTTYILNTVMIAVTLIVVAVPEGLPMSVTLSLAFSMRKLMKENTLPRTMHACETMGATSVICTDKTGTLTQNQMQVSETKLADIKPELVAEMIAINTTANLDFADPKSIKAIGNPTEGALLLWLHANGTNYLPIREDLQIIDRLPFSTENKYMATVVMSKVLGKKVLYVKGAPEILIGMSDLSASDKETYEKVLLDCQNKAMRTLSMAYLELSDADFEFREGKLNVNNLQFVGVFAISDPVRNDVPAAIQSCINAGIQVKIVTGDTPGTAKEIGRQIGLWTDSDTDRNILTGTEFAAMSDEELATRVQELKILSRARPNDKERLVKMLKSQDLVVAATGDGTNDAPALNVADVGLSMGDGTAVAKEASDMTIQDNSFHTIENAVMWGRSLYKNIQRFIMFQMTINVAACLIVLIGAFIGTESPLTVTQMLWVNLIMDTFAAIALASLPPTHTVMKEKPRKITDSIINRSMAWNIFGVGGLFTLLLLGLLLVMQHADITAMSDLLTFKFGAYDGLSAYELSLFFTIFVMLQFWNMFNAKAFMTGKSAFAEISKCKGFMFIAAVIFIGQIIIVEVGGKMFNVTHLNPNDWLVIILLSSCVLWFGELDRIKRRLRRR
ncbi:MAG: cation-translocating P-type ATPase [Salinivirgaceae bacterium]|nr:cation-translocating P-type ATPase [Salinivirgaceae bacterium]